jgi:hypothetical protein
LCWESVVARAAGDRDRDWKSLFLEEEEDVSNALNEK